MSRKQAQKRSRATASEQKGDPKDASSIPLAYPSTVDGSSVRIGGKTLIEIAEERQRELRERQQQQTQSNKNNGPDPGLRTTWTKIPSGGQNKDKEEEQGEGDVVMTAIVETLLSSLPLTTLHFTLSLLAAHQYAMTIEYGRLFRETVLVAFPILTALVALAHGHVPLFPGFSALIKKKKKKKRESFWSPSLPTLVLYLPLAVVLGCYLIRMTNEDPYYFVMKKAPSIGTLWVWAVLEMDTSVALIGAFVLPLVWGVVYMRYSII
ncbi:hypothetical protein VTN31DRAFT_2852 [Thermomyces dupontii]|uniref:uncharacterized protein n=1 Tax=Talaromyces thermophilus TaxID=28565 RepID=UPI0037436F54